MLANMESCLMLGADENLDSTDNSQEQAPGVHVQTQRGNYASLVPPVPASACKDTLRLVSDPIH